MKANPVRIAKLEPHLKKLDEMVEKLSQLDQIQRGRKRRDFS